MAVRACHFVNFCRPADRSEVVVTFLAMLELVRLKLVRLMQNSRFGAIWLYPAVAGEEAASLQLEEDSLGYI
jgi:segregation and condensation protein A